MLDYRPAELLHAWRRWRDGHSTMGNGRPVPSDIHLIAPMVRYLGYLTQNPTGGKPWPDKRHVYSCVHFTDDNECAIYDMRPTMCRTFPDDNVCEYGCGYTHSIPPELISLTALARRKAIPCPRP